jgi:hypothetical protein
MDVRGWRKIAKDRDVWKLILKEVRGPVWTVRASVEREKLYFVLIFSVYFMFGVGIYVDILNATASCFLLYI